MLLIMHQHHRNDADASLAPHEVKVYPKKQTFQMIFHKLQNYQQHVKNSSFLHHAHIGIVFQQTLSSSLSLLAPISNTSVFVSITTTVKTTMHYHCQFS